MARNMPNQAQKNQKESDDSENERENRNGILDTDTETKIPQGAEGGGTGGGWREEGYNTNK